MEVRSDKSFINKWNSYPPEIAIKLDKVRTMIHQVADSEETISILNETLRWGEPSFITKFGSTLRMDWKIKSPQYFALYFQCTSLLVPTFREIFGDLLKFEGNRAILIYLEEEIPIEQLSTCVKLTLTYHKRKHLPWLGAI